MIVTMFDAEGKEKYKRKGKPVGLWPANERPSHHEIMLYGNCEMNSLEYHRLRQSSKVARLILELRFNSFAIIPLHERVKIDLTI